jgi:hypothetical protein
MEFVIIIFVDTHVQLSAHSNEEWKRILVLEVIEEIFMQDTEMMRVLIGQCGLSLAFMMMNRIEHCASMLETLMLVWERSIKLRGAKQTFWIRELQNVSFTDTLLDVLEKFAVEERLQTFGSPSQVQYVLH